MPTAGHRDILQLTTDIATKRSLKRGSNSTKSRLFTQLTAVPALFTEQPDLYSI